MDVLRLIQDIEWTTIAAEQQHASAATLSRYHPEYGLKTLIARALVFSTNRILPGKTDTGEALEKHRRFLTRLDRRRNPT